GFLSDQRQSTGAAVPGADGKSGELGGAEVDWHQVKPGCDRHASGADRRGTVVHARGERWQWLLQPEYHPAALWGRVGQQCRAGGDSLAEWAGADAGARTDGGAAQ